MSDVRVNLLPREYEERARARRATAITVLALVLLCALLAFVYLGKVAQVNAARDQRDAAQAEVTRLEGDLAALAEFGRLAERLDTRNTQLAVAMEDEISWASVFNDISLSFPANSSLQTLAATASEPDPEPAGTDGVEVDPDLDPDLDALDQDTVANIVFTGYSVERYAPGVEGVLLEFDDVEAFFSTFLATAGLEEIGEVGVTDFEGSVQLSPDAYTNRYADGLPDSGVLP